MKAEQMLSSHGHRGLLRVVMVKGRGDLKRFILTPWTLYRHDGMWVPPLLVERRQHLSARNPYFQHADWCAWLAYRNNQIVGRITAQVDRLFQERHGADIGFFGMLEAEDDAETFVRLFDTAEDWLRQRGVRRVRGPFNLSINDECGLLVDGFDSPPSLMMGHALPYYGTRVEDAGYSPAKDLIAYRLNTNLRVPKVMARLSDKMQERISIRPLDRSKLDRDLDLLRDIFNDAWSENWGFVPFTEAEFTAMGHDLVRLIDDDFIQIAEVEGEAAAMIVLLPNINEIIRDLNGRLLPFGWLKLLWRLKARYPSSARIPLMGVRKQHQSRLLASVLVYRLIQALRGPGRRRGIREVEMSWILEENTRVRHVIEGLGSEAYKRYRIYEKTLP